MTAVLPTDGFDLGPESFYETHAKTHLPQIQAYRGQVQIPTTLQAEADALR